MPEPILVIACGALALEIDALKRRWGWRHLHLKCIDARLHNRPAEIPGRLRQMIRRHRDAYSEIFVAYADCGTAGGIDRVLAEEGAERLEGAHCYEFFAGRERFAALSDAEPGTFYLTDFLARHFDRFVVKPLGLDRHPELRDAYFGNYRKVVYLSQTEDARLLEAAARAASRLELDFEHVHCGYGELESSLTARLAARRESSAVRQNRGSARSTGREAGEVSISWRANPAAGRRERPERIASRIPEGLRHRPPGEANHGQENPRLLA